MTQLDYQSHAPVPRRRIVLRRRIPLIVFALDIGLIVLGLFLLMKSELPGVGGFALFYGTAMLGWHTYRRMTAPPTVAEYAKKLVTIAKRGIETPRDRQRVGPEAFASLHVEFYDRNRQALEALGFRHLGDWTERKAATMFGLYRVARTMISGDGTIIASISETAPIGRTARHARADRFRRQKLVMTSRFSDGLIVHTTNDPSDQREYLPTVRAFYTTAQSPADLLAEHRGHVAALHAECPERTLIRTQTLEEIFRRADEMITAVAEHKRRHGYLTAQQYRRMLGRPLKPWEESVARELEKLQLETQRATAKPPPLPGV